MSASINGSATEPANQLVLPATMALYLNYAKNLNNTVIHAFIINRIWKKLLSQTFSFGWPLEMTQL